MMKGTYCAYQYVEQRVDGDSNHIANDRALARGND
jgi:hypothetical protein